MISLSARGAGNTPCAVNSAFSCPSNTECVPTLASNSSVICCPNTEDCTLIQPLTCDISQQDAIKYPDNLVHTSNLTASLPPCGSACCPLGYNCQGGTCVLQYQAPKPSTSPSSSSASPASSSTITLSSSTSTSKSPDSAATGAPASATPTSQPSSSGGNSKIGLAIGLTFGAVSALALILALLWCLKRRKRNQAKTISAKRHSQDTDFMGTTPRAFETFGPDSTGSRNVQMTDRRTGALVSNPIAHPDFNSGMPMGRTDFLLRRGSVETGWEDKIKPSWSVRSKYRPKSKLLRSLSKGSKSGGAPKTPDASRMPVFTTPLRFGLPVNTAGTPDRPPAGGANMAKLIDVGGKSVRSGAAVRVDNQTPPPSRAKKYRSGATVDSVESGSWSDGEDDEKARGDERMTMNLFYSPMPTPEAKRVRDDEVLGSGGERRQTTFADLMNRAARPSIGPR